MRRLWIGLLLALLGAAPAWAEPARLTCNNGDTSYIPNPDRAKVIGADKAYFVSDDPDKGCPDATAACRRKAYVMPGDVVLTSFSGDGYICGYLPSSKGGTGGYLPLDRVQMLPSLPDAPLSAWVGTWLNGDNVIRISIKGSGLAVDADAYWPSAHPAPAAFPRGPNKAHVSAVSPVVHNYAMFDDGAGGRDCVLETTLVLDALEVQDNQGCGARHADFVGEFHRAP